MIDRLVLQALKQKARFRLLNTSVPKDMLDPITVQLLDWYHVYFKAHPEHEVVDIEALTTLMRLRSGLDSDSMEAVAGLLEYLDQDVADDILQHTVGQLEELAFVGKASAMIARYHNNEEIDITYEVQRLAEETRNRINVQSEATFCDDDIADLLDDGDEDGGIRITCLPELDKNLIGLRTGNNIAVVAPTNMGKTALMCKLAVAFQSQAKDMFPGRPLLYLINEGTAKVIKPRIWQTALGVDRNQAREMAIAGTLVPAFEAIVGDQNSIRCINIHGLAMPEVLRIIERHKPWCVITDMTGRIKPSKPTGNESKDLEEVWNTMREEAARMDFLHVGSIQVSADGFDNLFPELDNMQWSRVGIQTTLDLAIMMGALKDPMMAQLRGISTPKSKLAKTGVSDLNYLKYFFDNHTNSWNIAKV